MCDGQMTVKEICDKLRVDIKGTGDLVHVLLTHPETEAEDKYPNQRGEMKANIMLAYRHLEDARMRVGKILQAAGDGISILDK